MEEHSEDFENLKIKGFELSKTTISKIGAVYYDKLGNEDNWIEIFPIYNLHDNVGVNYVYTCSTIRSCVFPKDENVEARIISNMPDELLED